MSAITQQRTFAGGELAPALYARTDTTKYATGLRTLRNMFIQRHGGAANRPGTEFGTAVKDSTKPVRLLKFVFNAGQTYVFEFGDFYMRIMQANSPVVVAPAAWNNATAYIIGDLVVSGGVNYYCVQAHTNQLPPNATYWYPLTGAIYEIPTPYAVADLPGIRYVESADTVTFVHPNYAPYELKRFGNTTWTLQPIVFAPSIAAPVGTPTTTGGGAGGTVWWRITAVAAETGEESLGADTIQTSTKVPSAATPTTVNWTAVAGAQGYNIYRSTDATSFGLVGFSLTPSFTDQGQTPDFLSAPPNARNPFSVGGKYPTAVAYYQQRRIFANSNAGPETVWGSRTGLGWNFTTSFPLQDDDAVTFSLTGRQVNSIQHMLDLGRLILFTSAEEKMVEGDQAGILRPDAINPRKLSANGSGTLRPLEIDDSAIFLQARGSKVRDFKPISADAYEGTDLTVFAAHLFDGFTIVDWDYAQNPHSIVWAVRSDGVLLGLTYLREHAIWGWHRHDTDGAIENVCVVPEGAEDRVYLVVRRTINGVTKRYIERLASRFYTDEEDAVFVDCSLSYNGWNTAATTVTLSAGALWNESELLTATVSTGLFSPTDVGSVVILQLLDAFGNELDRVRFRITAYVTAQVAQGFVDKTVPVGLRATAVTSWAIARKYFSGLSHLEGKAVAALGDADVAASPNNADYPVVTVVGGVATFDSPYAVVHIGLPYISDLVTLDLDGAGQLTIKDKKMLINKLGVFVERTRGFFAGLPDRPTATAPLQGLTEYKFRDTEGYNDPVQPETDFLELITEGDWNNNGRMMIRNVDPVPLTVLSITPMGFIPT